MDRRAMIKVVGAAGLASALPLAGLGATDWDGLANLSLMFKPIGREERIGRIERLQAQLRKAGIGAILIEAGSSLDYFTAIQWWRSERITAAVIPADGEPMIVTPFFEAPSILEMLDVPASVLTWNEHENPMALVADWLHSRKLARHPLALEETTREFIRDGLQKQLPRLSIVSGAEPVRAVRMRKRPPEIEVGCPTEHNRVRTRPWQSS